MTKRELIEKAVADWDKAYANLSKAIHDWGKANADWGKANAMPDYTVEAKEGV